MIYRLLLAGKFSLNLLFLGEERQLPASPFLNPKRTQTNAKERKMDKENEDRTIEEVLQEWDDLGRPTCEGCEAPAIHSDSEGVPLCSPCLANLRAVQA